MPAFKYPRTSQPQGAVEIDLSNPITVGLKELFVSSAGLFGLVSHKSLVPLASAPDRVIGLGGIAFEDRGLDISGASNKGYSTPGVYCAGTSEFTMFILFESFDAPSASGYGAVAAEDDSVAFQFHHGNAAFQNTFAIKDSSAQWRSPKFDTPVANKIYLWVGTYKSGLVSAYTNGILTSSVATSSGAVASATVGRLLTRSGGYNFNGRLYLSGYSGRALSPTEIKSLRDNPYQLFKPQSRSLWIPGTVSSGGAATVIPIGQQATGSVGTLVATGAAKALPSGVSASIAVGTPVAVGGSSIPATVAPAGVSATVSVGTATATGQAKAYPAGVSATASVGSAVAVGQARAFPPGVSASTGVGTPVAVAGGAAIATPSGVQAVGAVGNLIATGQAWRVASGVSATGAVGTPVVLAGGSAIATPTGLQAVGSTGTPVATGACRTYPLGLAGYWSVGAPIAVPGVSGVAVAYPSGVQAGGYVGVPTAKGSSVAFAPGVYATGQVGFPVAGLLSIIPPGHVKFVPDAASYAFTPGTDAYSFEVNT